MLNFRPWLSYRDLSLTFAFVACALFLCLLLLPEVIHWLFGIASEPATDFMSRRAGLLFLGLSIIAFQARNAQRDPLRRGISLGIAVLMAGLVILGVVEFLQGNASIGIWLAIVVEVIFAALYARFLFGKN